MQGVYYMSICSGRPSTNIDFLRRTIRAQNFHSDAIRHIDGMMSTMLAKRTGRCAGKWARRPTRGILFSLSTSLQPLDIGVVDR